MNATKPLAGAMRNHRAFRAWLSGGITAHDRKRAACGPAKRFVFPLEFGDSLRFTTAHQDGDPDTHCGDRTRNRRGRERDAHRTGADGGGLQGQDHVVEIIRAAPGRGRGRDVEVFPEEHPDLVVCFGALDLVGDEVIALVAVHIVDRRLRAERATVAPGVTGAEIDRRRDGFNRTDPLGGDKALELAGLVVRTKFLSGR